MHENRVLSDTLVYISVVIYCSVEIAGPDRSIVKVANSNPTKAGKIFPHNDLKHYIWWSFLPHLRFKWEYSHLLLKKCLYWFKTRECPLGGLITRSNPERFWNCSKTQKNKNKRRKLLGRDSQDLLSIICNGSDSKNSEFSIFYSVIAETILPSILPALVVLYS